MQGMLGFVLSIHSLIVVVVHVQEKMPKYSGLLYSIVKASSSKYSRIATQKKFVAEY